MKEELQITKYKNKKLQFWNKNYDAFLVHIPYFRKKM